MEVAKPKDWAALSLPGTSSSAAATVTSSSWVPDEADTEPSATVALAPGARLPLQGVVVQPPPSTRCWMEAAVRVVEPSFVRAASRDADVVQASVPVGAVMAIEASTAAEGADGSRPSMARAPLPVGLR